MRYSVVCKRLAFFIKCLFFIVAIRSITAYFLTNRFAVKSNPEISVSFITPSIHYIVYSAFYYSSSKLYAPNSMIILLNSHKEIYTQNPNFQCFSKNATNTLNSDVLLRMGNPPSPDCSWEFFIANCSTVLNPTFFGFMTKEDSKNAIEIEYNLPIKKQYPVVMCYPPMVYESRWQQIIFATEIYHFFGADLQIQYINSAMNEIVDILEKYEAKGWIKIEKFAFFDFDSPTISSIGINPMLEIKFRNLPLAFTDCLMKYREASEFIITADVDDVLFPKKDSYYDEFLSWKDIYPNAATFMYHRSFAKLEAPNDFKSFSISKAIKSIQIGKSFFVGKSIHRTDKVETAWIHWPGIDNTSTISIPPEKGRMFHVQIHDAKIRKVKNVYELFENTKDNLTLFSNFVPVSKKDIAFIEDSFKSTFVNAKTFNSNFVYTEMLFQCFSNTANLDFKLPCFTPLSCEIPKIVPGFNCVTMRRNFTAKTFNNNLNFYVPQKRYYEHKNRHGCTILSNN